MMRDTGYLEERVGDFMGGKILITRTDEILNKGREEGMEKGMEKGRLIEKTDTIHRLYKQKLPIHVIAAGVGMDEATVKQIIGI